MKFSDSVKSRWPEELTVRFVELYKGYECLWNIHSPAYKDRDLKRMALDNIAANVGIPGFSINDVRQKIKNLRCTYCQEKAKIEKSQKEEGAKLYVPNVKWYGSMDEIMNYIKTNAGPINKPKPKIKLEAKLDDIEDEFEEQFYEYLEDDLQFEDTILKVDDEINQHNEESSSSKDLPVKSDQKSTSSNFSFISCGYSGTSRKKKLQEVDEESPPEKKPDLMDECQAFGKYIGLGLRKLPVELSIQAQQEIQETLTRYRLLAMKTSASTSGTN